MKRKYTILILVLIALVIDASQAFSVEPSNPNMTHEARALLELYYNISGKYILTGQHNYPISKDRNSLTAAKVWDEVTRAL